MNTKEKGKINEALKLFDNKEYKNCKKACDKILEKQPTNADAMALKGLNMYFLNEKIDGAKAINDAIKLNIRNANSWHFFALFHKEDKNYSQAMRCYIQAQKHDPENFNVVRDLSYLQLYLRQYESFFVSARRGMELRSNMMINWTTYAFASYLTRDYGFAFKLMESALKIGGTSIKDQERHEIYLFMSLMLTKQNKYEEALNFLLENENLMKFDTTTLSERVIFLAIKINKKETAINYLNRLLKINPEKIDYFIDYLNVMHEVRISNFEDLTKFTFSEIEKSEALFKTLQEDLKPRIRSRVINRLELALSKGEKFKEVFSLYFLQNVKQNLPSFFINVKFLYTLQHVKIPIVEEVLSKHLESIKSSGSLDQSLTNGELLDLAPNLIWVYFFAAQHFDYLRNLESALQYIEKAIDSTPSVVEFYMVKSKILKHGGFLNESAKSYEKAKKLDIGDRFLNAKCAKIHARMGDVNRSVEIMKEFVKDPLSDENIEHFQCMWYETECGHSYLKSKNILRAHRLFKFIAGHFNTLIEDQFDFYNYCLRRFMINDFVNTVEFMDRILDQKYVYKTLEAFEIILHYLKNNNNKETEKSLKNEHEDMLKEKLEKYKYKDMNTLITEIENDIFNLCLKLQPYSKIVHLHHLSVRTFLKRGKILLTLKSLIYLQNHAHDSFEYLDAIHSFSHYLNENRQKINPSYLEIIHQKVDLLKSEETLQKFLKDERVKLVSKRNSTGQVIQSLLTNAYESIFNKTQTIEESLETLLDNSQNTLRLIKSEHINKLQTYLSLFSNENFSKNLMKNFYEKIVINVDVKEVTKNLGFYE